MIKGQSVLHVDLYIVVIGEVDPIYKKEVRILKGFSAGKDKDKFLIAQLKSVFKGIDQTSDLELWEYLVGLYFDEIDKLAKKEKIKMTLIERNIEKWNNALGLKERYINEAKIEIKKEALLEAKMEDARKMIEFDYELEEIHKITGLSMDKILSLQEEIVA